MFVARSINAEHKDLIHDVAYDFYGRRMATCSSDQSVKVWDQGEGEQWHCTANWKTHSGSVWKVTWAHPEFGQVIATCSFDRTAAVWEEIIGDSPAGVRGQSHWVKRTSLVDSRTSVTDVKFAPKHLGLLLATCSADGVVRIYEATDVMNLSQWSLQHDVPCKLPCSCLAWNPSVSRLHPPMIAVGSDDTNPSAGGKVFIYEYSENSRRWAKVETLSTITEPAHDLAFAPNMGRSYHVLAIATKDVRIVTLKPLQSGSCAGTHLMFSYPKFHLSSQPEILRRFDQEYSLREGIGSATQSSLSRFEIRQAGQFDDHSSTVWRVCWNITGTILASSGDDGRVRLWKANYLGNWKCLTILKGDGTHIQTDTNFVGSASVTAGAGPGGPAPGTARYYKLGAVSDPSQVPWH